MKTLILTLNLIFSTVSISAIASDGSVTLATSKAVAAISVFAPEMLLESDAIQRKQLDETETTVFRGQTKDCQDCQLKMIFSHDDSEMVSAVISSNGFDTNFGYLDFNAAIAHGWTKAFAKDYESSVRQKKQNQLVLNFKEPAEVSVENGKPKVLSRMARRLELETSGGELTKAKMKFSVEAKKQNVECALVSRKSPL